MNARPPVPAVSASPPSHPQLSPARRPPAGASLPVAAVIPSLVPAPEPRVPAAPPASPRSARAWSNFVARAAGQKVRLHNVSKTLHCGATRRGPHVRPLPARGGGVSGLGLPDRAAETVRASAALFPQLPGAQVSSPSSRPFPRRPVPQGLGA